MPRQAGSSLSSQTLELAKHHAYNCGMTNLAKQLIDSFEALPEAEKHEVLGQLLRRLMDKPYASPSDDELSNAADLLFLDYDHREDQG